MNKPELRESAEKLIRDHQVLVLGLLVFMWTGLYLNREEIEMERLMITSLGRKKVTAVIDRLKGRSRKPG